MPLEDLAASAASNQAATGQSKEIISSIGRERRHIESASLFAATPADSVCAFLTRAPNRTLNSLRRAAGSEPARLTFPPWMGNPTADDSKIRETSPKVSRDVAGAE